MAKNIGATLSLNNGNFFTNMKSAITASNKLKTSLDGTGKATTAFGDKLQSVSGKAASVAKGITIAGTAAATAVGAMVTKSVNSFAEYEQLIGGVETLFKSSAETVKGYANEAYKNAGLSANEYMSTVTSFSASLINSMGGDTEAAASRANMAINDMSDNANKMGSNMDTIMQTYQSISRGNYGMLDNLKLGYGGTKKEMERLIADAERMRAEIGKPIDYDISSFSDVVSAIHDIQTSMGITGTTSKEAATTISGSLNMLKASWNNTLTAITVGGDTMTGMQAAAFAPLTTATIAQIAATQALNVVTGAFGAIMTFVTSPIGLVVIAIGAVIAIGVLLYKHWDTVKAKALELWNGMKNVFANIKNSVSEKFNAVKKVMGNVMDGAKNIVSQKLNNIKNAYSEHGGGIKGISAGYMTASVTMR